MSELLDRFGLAEAAGRPVRTYSGGQRRRLDVALGLVHRPSVLFLDVPTTGLDPEARASLWQEIDRLSTVEQLTVLLTTHYLEEADRLARRLAIVDKGRVVVEGRPDGLKGELRGDAVHVELRDPADSPAAVATIGGLAGIRALSNVLGMTVRQRDALIGLSIFLLLPLTFLSTAFMARDLMPGWMQAVADANPVNWALDAARGALDRTVDWSAVLAYGGALAALAIGFVALSSLTFRAYQRTV